MWAIKEQMNCLGAVLLTEALKRIPCLDRKRNSLTVVSNTQRPGGAWRLHLDQNFHPDSTLRKVLFHIENPIALDDVEEGRLRSLFLMTALMDGSGECWSRIMQDDQTSICDYLATSRRDMECQETGELS